MPERRLTDYHYEKERFIPRYELLKRLLLDEFSSMPAEEEFLPTQEMLAERYKVSRNTVRRALAKLQREGYIQTSTKTGSRILKRAVEARRPVDSRRNAEGCIGLLITNNSDDNLRKEDIRTPRRGCRSSKARNSCFQGAEPSYPGRGTGGSRRGNQRFQAMEKAGTIMLLIVNYL